MPNREELREMFYYHEGVLYWKHDRRGGGARKGLVAGCMRPSGYSAVWVHGRAQRLHRLIWNYFNNTCEGYLVDHKDGNTRNNLIENLRLATYQENRRNSLGNKKSQVGFKGVHLKGKGFQAQLWVDGRNKSFGTFRTPEEASAAFEAAAKALHGDFYRKA